MAKGAGRLLARLQAQDRRGDGAKAIRSDAGAGRVSGAHALPRQGDGSDPRACPACGDGRLSLRGGRFGAFIACSNYPECKFTRKFAQDGGGQDEGIAADGPVELGADPDTGEQITLRSGRFGPYVQRGEGKEARSEEHTSELQ